MNLPVHIQFSSKGSIYYVYDAAGTKWSKHVADSSKQVKTEYIGGFQYKAGKLLFFSTAEGYIKAVYEETGNAPAAYRYVYTYKDHLGNNRLSYTLNPATNKVEVLEENHYYPFGLTHPYNSTKRELKFDTAGNLQIMQVTEKELGFKYYYQEQERQDELNLNWDSFKYRNYDYAIGRFMSIDPLAEDYPYMSTYQFAGNKPTWSREIEGLESAVDLKMRLREAAYNAPKLNMSAPEYFQQTAPSFDFRTEYRPQKNAEGRVVIDNNMQAIQHYYRGNGEPVVLGQKTIELIKNSKDVQHYITRIKSGATSGPAKGEGLPVNLTGLHRGFHLGHMTFSYTTTCKGGNCTTNIAVDDDGFVDPNSMKSRLIEGSDDGAKPNNELGGIPYNYDPVEWKITYPNPGYQIDENNLPLPMNKTIKEENENQ